MIINPAIESEKMIIGALLLDCTLFKTIENKLIPHDFSDKDLQQIFEAMSKIYKKRTVFDIAMLIDETNFRPEFLLELANNCYSTENISAHADIVREKSVQFRLIDCKKEMDNKNE